MQQASHRIVCEQGRVGNLLLPFTDTWGVLCACQESVPVAARKHLDELISNKILCQRLERLGRVYDVGHVVLVDSFIIVELSLVTKSLKPLHVHMEIEVSR